MLMPTPFDPHKLEWRFINYYVSTANDSTYTFSDIPIGDFLDHNDRHVVVCFGARGGNHAIGASTCNSGSGDISLALLVEEDGGTANTCGVLIAPVPEGDTLSVTMNLSTGSAGAAIGVYVVSGLISPEARDTDRHEASGGVLDECSMEPGGLWFGCVIANGNGLYDVSGLTADANTAVDSSAFACGAVFSEDAATPNVAFAKGGTSTNACAASIR